MSKLFKIFTMSAHDQIRSLLDQLMGTSRNGDGEDEDEGGRHKRRIRFDDDDVCKSFLLDCCPHDILSLTRYDLGPCPKIHKLALIADYENARKRKDYFYDLDALEHLTRFVEGAEKKKEEMKQRLIEIQEEIRAQCGVKAKRVESFKKEISENLTKAESLGAQGFVQESIRVMDKVEKLRGKLIHAENELRDAVSPPDFQRQTLCVCEVCCAYLDTKDRDRQLADHFGGKLHLGFMKIRQKVQELKVGEEERRKKRSEVYRLARDAQYEEEGAYFGGWRHGRVPGGSWLNKREQRERRESRRDRSRSRSRSRGRGRSPSPNPSRNGHSSDEDDSE